MLKKIKLAIWVAVAVLIGAGIATAGPKVLVEQPVFEFEAVPEGVVVQNSFVIKNVGDAQLIIQNVVPP